MGQEHSQLAAYQDGFYDGRQYERGVRAIRRHEAGAACAYVQQGYVDADTERTLAYTHQLRRQQQQQYYQAELEAEVRARLRAKLGAPSYSSRPYQYPGYGGYGGHDDGYPRSYRSNGAPGYRHPQQTGRIGW